MTLDAADVEARFAAVLDSDEAGAAAVLGVEHEYMVYRGATPLDFRELIHTLQLDGSLLHPVDEHRYLTPGGLALMADGIVAEVATPPEPLQPTVTTRLDGWGALGHRQFAEALPSDVRLKGVSTHISVECPAGLEDEVAWQYALRYAPAFMLLLDDAKSPGLLVRPRPSRIELAGEYATGARLRSAIAFAAGSVLSLVEAVRGGHELPLPALDVDIEPARRRFGWYVDRAAFGSDLYSSGRQTPLRRFGGAQLTAQAHLDRSWQIARAAIVDTVGVEDLAAADAAVSAAAQLPSEVAIDRTPGAVLDDAMSHAVGDATLPRDRDGMHVRPLAVTWDFAAFDISDGRRNFVGTVPRRLLTRFLSLLDQGDLDSLLRDAMKARLVGRVLASAGQTEGPGLFGTILLTSALLPRDRTGVGDGTFASMAIGKIPLSVLMPQASTALIATAANAVSSDAAASATGSADVEMRRSEDQPPIEGAATVVLAKIENPSDEALIVLGRTLIGLSEDGGPSVFARPFEIEVAAGSTVSLGLALTSEAAVDLSVGPAIIETEGDTSGYVFRPIVNRASSLAQLNATLIATGAQTMDPVELEWSATPLAAIEHPAGETIQIGLSTLR